MSSQDVFEVPSILNFYTFGRETNAGPETNESMWTNIAHPQPVAWGITPGACVESGNTSRSLHAPLPASSHVHSLYNLAFIYSFCNTWARLISFFHANIMEHWRVVEQDTVTLRGRLGLQGQMVQSQLEREPRIQESDQGRALDLRSLHGNGLCSLPVSPAPGLWAPGGGVLSLWHRALAQKEPRSPTAIHSINQLNECLGVGPGFFKECGGYLSAWMCLREAGQLCGKGLQGDNPPLLCFYCCPLSH